MCAAWLARTEQRLELTGFAQLMLSVVRFWPQQGEPDSWPSTSMAVGWRLEIPARPGGHGGVVGDADAQESHRRTEGHPRPDPRRCRESSGAEHHTAGAQNVHQAGPQAHADQVGRLRRDHLRSLSASKSMREKFASWAREAVRTHAYCVVSRIHACDRPGARRRAGEPPPLTDVPFSAMLPRAIIETPHPAIAAPASNSLVDQRQR